MKRITVLVSNDLTYDQRVRKVCASLSDMGFEISLIGRQVKNSPPIERPYHTRRFKLGFTKGALFYAALNFRLFFYLLFCKTDIILANDLDTLLPAYLVSKLRGKELVYDSHEYFTEAAGLTGRNFQKRIWLAVEKFTFPNVKRIYTVNESIAGFYREKYMADVGVIRNIPPRSEKVNVKSREELGLPLDKKIILLQGAFIDIDRGAKEVALAMEHLEDVIFLIIGAGEEFELVKRIVKEKGLEDKVIYKEKMPFVDLQQYSLNADLGLSLDKPIHLNYKYSLPNKLFDYIQAELPVLTSRLPELERIHQQYAIGAMIDKHEPKHIAERIQSTLHSQEMGQWKKNLKEASEVFTWEQESLKLKDIYKGLL